MLRVFIVALVAVCVSTPGCAPNGRAAPTEPVDPARTESLTLASFDGTSARVDERSGEWRTVNDNIMGGRSLGGGVIRDGALVFAGSTNTDGGGFSSVRANDRAWDLAGFDGLGARVRADGRRYVFHVFTGLRYNNGNVFYRGEFATDRLIDASGDPRAGADAWQEVFVAFADFVPMVRGRAVTGRVEPLDPSRVRGIGLMIDDGLDGPFRLDADWIRAERRPAEG